MSALCLTGRSEQRAQVPINAHKVHECRDVSSLPLRLAQPGAGRCCAGLHPRSRDQPPRCQVPFPSARASSTPGITHVPGQDLPRGWNCSAEHVRTVSDTECGGDTNRPSLPKGDRAQAVTSHLRGGIGADGQCGRSWEGHTGPG